jgi:hypothetical protein
MSTFFFLWLASRPIQSRRVVSLRSDVVMTTSYLGDANTGRSRALNLRETRGPDVGGARLRLCALRFN